MEITEITGAMLTRVTLADTLTYDPAWGTVLDVGLGDVTISHPVSVSGATYRAPQDVTYFDETFTDVWSASVFALRYLEMAPLDINGFDFLTICDPT